MWSVDPDDQYLRQSRYYEKKRPRQLEAVLLNLDKVKKALDAGARPRDVKAGFLHPEPCGVLAVTEQGAVKPRPKATRLYIYPEEGEMVLHLITLGDKNTQKDDIAYCTQFVETQRRNDDNQKV
jgi:hypothetical protein